MNTLIIAFISGLTLMSLGVILWLCHTVKRLIDELGSLERGLKRRYAKRRAGRIAALEQAADYINNH